MLFLVWVLVWGFFSFGLVLGFCRRAVLHVAEYFSSILELRPLDASSNPSPLCLQTLFNVPLANTQSLLGEKHQPKTKLRDRK